MFTKISLYQNRNISVNLYPHSYTFNSDYGICSDFNLDRSGRYQNDYSIVYNPLVFHATPYCIFLKNLPPWPPPSFQTVCSPTTPLTSSCPQWSFTSPKRWLPSTPSICSAWPPTTPTSRQGPLLHYSISALLHTIPTRQWRFQDLGTVR